jgi:disulfide bond formation protein DsbB
MARFLIRGIVVSLAGLGVAGQIAAGALLVVALMAAVGLRRPLGFVLKSVKGFELWLAFLVAGLATGGSLFFSEVAHFPPCEVCWYQRICMYPLAVATLVAAASGAGRAARWLLPLSVVGAGLSAYHVLIENGLAPQTIGCLQSSPGGCALKWIEEFGYVTIPMMALTAFALVFAFLLMAALEAARTTPEDTRGVRRTGES